VYEAFYGFTVKPFGLSPQEEFIYLSRQHRLALELLVYGLRNQAMFCVVTGEIGTGKTTLMRHLFHGRGPGDAIAMITGTLGTYTELLQWVLSEFGVEHQGLDKITLQHALVQQLKWVNSRNKRVVLVVDEAHSLEPDVLEELRLFSNINAGSTILLQTVLVGQPQLRDTLRRKDMRPLAQRIGADYVLTPLDQEQTHEYIRHRLGLAGANREGLFTADACNAIYAASQGVPRIINLFCDTALVYGYADQKPVIGAETVNEMLADKARHGGWLFQSRVPPRRPQASDKPSAADPDRQAASAPVTSPPAPGSQGPTS
jgi:type II secretory pathway predicted ATPase ExeA